MGIFNSRIELKDKLEEQKNELARLESEKDTYLREIAELNGKITKLIKENRGYEERYVNTDLNCEFCYTTLQEEFQYCPKCGKKIIKTKESGDAVTDVNIFQTEEDGDYLLINQYNGFHDKKIVIPSHIDGRPVIGIWNSVFENCTDLEELIIEDGCKYIGENAFANCNRLKKVRLPKSLLEIGDAAFKGCDIKEIAVPPNVSVIGRYAFAHCPLKKIILPDNLKYISSGMLSYTSIEEINIPESVIHIDSMAFYKTRLKEIELPRNLYSIGDDAFEISGLSKITIHSNVKIINEHIFGLNKMMVKPTIYCAAGSKGLLYARKNGINCCEIPPVPMVNADILSSGISFFMSNVYANKECIEEVYRYIGMNKAETWSWKVESGNIRVNKAMDMNDAFCIKKKIYNLVNSDYRSRKTRERYSVKEFRIESCWGIADV